jgi:hypothetical protein
LHSGGFFLHPSRPILLPNSIPLDASPHCWKNSRIGKVHPMKTHGISNSDGAQRVAPPIQDFASFLRELGRDPITGWRWRKAGMIQTVNICGRQYVTAEAVAEFKRRAEAGEFAKHNPYPGQRRVQEVP